MKEMAMDISKVEHLISKLDIEFYSVGAADEEKIKKIEFELNVLLPVSYKWFLIKFGHALIPGFTILGAGLSAIPSCVGETHIWRKYGLPAKYVVIENEGTDWITCLDTSRLNNGECPVVDWEQGKPTDQMSFENFLLYFESRLERYLTI